MSNSAGLRRRSPAETIGARLGSTTVHQQLEPDKLDSQCYPVGSVSGKGTAPSQYHDQAEQPLSEHAPLAPSGGVPFALKEK